MAEVRLEHVSKSFGEHEAIRDLCFAAPDGKFFFILGPSGAGKTTTLRMIAGLEDPTVGDIFIGGSKMNDFEPGDRNIAMAFENYALYPHLTVFENLAFPLRAPIRKKQFDAAEIEKRVRRVARLMQIESMLDRMPTQLSGGQKQRVALGRALIRQPSVYLLDEPIAHLDAKLRLEMHGELKQIQQEFAVTAIYTTPDQAEALAMADIVAVIQGGRLQQIGTPTEIYEHPANTFVAGFTGDPPMNFVDCEISSSDGQALVKLGTGQFTANGAIKGKLDQVAGRPLKLGVRPANISLARQADAEHYVRAEVYVWEIVGRNNQITLSAGTDRLRIKAPVDFKVDIGDQLYLGFDTAHLHLFDRETGNAL